MRLKDTVSRSYNQIHNTDGVGLEVEEEGGLDGGLSGMILFLADEGS